MENRFGERLKQLRTEKKMKQKEFAKLVDLTPSSVSAYEKGNRMPDLTIAQRIAEKTGASLDWLCGNDAPQTGKVNVDSFVWTDTNGVHAWASDVLKVLAFLSKYQFASILETNKGAALEFNLPILSEFLINIQKLMNLKASGMLSDEILEAALEGFYQANSNKQITPIEFPPPVDIKELQGLI